MKPLGKIPVPWHWYLGVAGMIVVSVTVSLTMLTLAPTQMPARVNSGLIAFDGNTSTAMTWESLLARVVAGPVLILVIGLGVALLITAQSERLVQDHPSATHTQLIRRWAFFNNVQACLGWFCFIFAAILTVSSLRLNGPGVVNPVEMALYAVSIAVLTWTLFISLRKGQVEIDRAIPVKEEESQLKWGIIYHNASDRRLFVELDHGHTTVINMARPASWLLVILMILPAVLIVAWILNQS